MVEDARGEHHVGPAALHHRVAARAFGAVDLAAHEGRRCRARGGARARRRAASWASARSSATTRSKTGREHLEQGAVAGAHVDREAAVGDERRERPRGRRRAPPAGPVRRRAPAAREELPRLRVARGEHVVDADERPVGSARGQPGGHGVGDDRIVGAPGARRSSVHVPCLRAASRPASRSAAAWRGDLGLPLAQQLGQLAHAQLLRRGEREEARPHRIGEEAVQLPPRGRALRVQMARLDQGHALYICAIVEPCN